MHDYQTIEAANLYHINANLPLFRVAYRLQTCLSNILEEILKMGDSTATKVDSEYSPTGEMGQKYLASGKSVAMRLWENEQPNDDKETKSRDYETVGYVISGKAELHLEGQILTLEAGDSYVVPKDAQHSYKIIESFTAVEATSPPAQAHGRDEK